MDMREKKLSERLVSAGLVKHAPPGKPFVLKSGKTSDIYVDLRTLGHHPKLRKIVVQRMVDAIPSLVKAWMKGQAEGRSYVAGLPLGGIELASLVSDRCEIPFLLIRKEAKDHGTGRIVEADITTETLVLLIDDVMSSGSTVREAIARFKAANIPIKVVGVVCVVNRCAGAPDIVPETDIPLYSLMKLDDLRHHGRESFDSRIALAQNVHAKRLFETMFVKKTNVCWSADVDTPERLLDIFAQIAPHIAMIKVHFDTIPKLVEPRHMLRLFRLAYENKVVVMGDRKFCDIGSTVRRQLRCHPACSEVGDISEQMDCCTVHTIAGPSGVLELASRSISSVLVAQMSNEGSITDDDFFVGYYAGATAKLAHNHSSAVMGLVCQSRIDCEAGDGFVYMTPGVHLEKKSDGKDQRYRDCQQAIAVQLNDVVIVGRGISLAPDPLEAVQRYKAEAWSAYTGTPIE